MPGKGAGRWWGDVDGFVCVTSCAGVTVEPIRCPRVQNLRPAHGLRWSCFLQLRLMHCERGSKFGASRKLSAGLRVAVWGRDAATYVRCDAS
eukprot:361100-Chlamydomonas_euryale.AAC.33